MGNKIKKDRRSIAVEEELVAWFNSLAEESGFSAHFLMRQALSWFRGYIDKNHKNREAICSVNKGGIDGKIR